MSQEAAHDPVDRPGAEVDSGTSSRLGLPAVGLALVAYVIALSVATWPRVAHLGTSVPSLFDPLQHLWILRWYRSCLLEGRSLILCPEVLYPTGVPLGCFSPLHFQAILFIPLSLVVSNDALCYNLVWITGLLTTGLGTFVLAWRLLGDRLVAGFAGLLAMLSGPMLWHASGHLELIFLGSFPFFLWTWLRLLDQPTRGRLAASVGAYVLVALCAAYFAVYAVFPAGLAFFWKGLRAGREGSTTRAWFRSRTLWLSSFSLLVLPCLVVIFGNHIWAMANGYTLPRSFSEFRAFSAPWWSYACPTGRHVLGRYLPGFAAWYTQAGLGSKLGECCSYLGMTSLLLVTYAGLSRVRFRDAGLIWASLALVVILAGGTSWTILGHDITLPSLWLKKHFPLFQMIRVPARFNLYAVVLASIVAAGGLRKLLGYVPNRAVRVGMVAVLAVLSVADLAMVPYFKAEIPPIPGCYAFIRRSDPGATLLEVPQFGSWGSDLYAICSYWQTRHRLRTNAGYCGQGNAVYDNLLTFNSPFYAENVTRPGYLSDAEKTSLELAGPIAFPDYAWLYLNVHGFRYVVYHKWFAAIEPMSGLDRLQTALAPARVYEDDATIVYDRERLRPPVHPTLLTTNGWRIGVEQGWIRVTEPKADLIVYNPDPDRTLRLSLAARSLRPGRSVRLRSRGREIALWEVQSGSYQDLASPLFRLPAGLNRLTLESDGATRPRSHREAPLDNDRKPYSLKVSRIELAPHAEIARRP